MHTDRTQQSSDRPPDSAGRKVPTTAAEDRAIQSAVLLVILDRHPALLTVAELSREIATEPVDFAQADAIDRALADLLSAGLLHRHGEFAIPTWAAICFDRLLGESGNP